jgi:hypothetical protein
MREMERERERERVPSSIQLQSVPSFGYTWIFHRHITCHLPLKRQHALRSGNDDNRVGVGLDAGRRRVATAALPLGACAAPSLCPRHILPLIDLVDDAQKYSTDSLRDELAEPQRLSPVRIAGGAAAYDGRVRLMVSKVLQSGSARRHE